MVGTPLTVIDTAFPRGALICEFAETVSELRYEVPVGV
jgi:hypothetical protein